jgi:hypothetical protein
MNDDHAEDCRSICSAADPGEPVDRAELVAFDPEGLVFGVEGPSGRRELRVPWTAPVRERADIRHQVIEMTHEVRARLSGPPRSLPGGGAVAGIPAPEPWSPPLFALPVR